jgi:hypothetical protein
MFGKGLAIAGALWFAGSAAHAQKPEARALWVTRFDYDSEAKIARIMETAARAPGNR